MPEDGSERSEFREHVKEEIKRLWDNDKIIDDRLRQIQIDMAATKWVDRIVTLIVCATIAGCISALFKYVLK